MIPDDVRRFVLTSVPSIPYLEAALLIRRDGTVEWSAKSLGRALYVSHTVADELLAALTSAGVITAATHAGHYRFAPRDAMLDTLLGRLAETYRTDTIGVTRLVHDVTQRSAQRLADAFKIRRDS